MSVDREADHEQQHSVDEPPTTPDDGTALPVLFVPASELYDPATGARFTHPARQASDEGAARLAVVGLDEDDPDVDPDDLEAEFREVFETFRLGHFGAQTIDEYVVVEDEEVSPVWGLAATIAACAAFTLWMRPDGDEQLERVQGAIDSIVNGQGVAA